jgi:presenilin-like A22 family membrane protease
MIDDKTLLFISMVKRSLLLMKHTLQVSIIIVAMFLVAQFIGLYAMDLYRDDASDDGLRPLPGGVERPEVSEAAAPWLMIFGILAGTLIILLLIKLNAKRAWSIWFALSIFMLSMISLSAFIPFYFALAISIAFAFIKTTSLQINWVIRNIPELFIYAGLAIIFAPLLNIWGAILLLVLISVYDMYAVWKSKHMVTLAKFQLDSGKFAGFNISYANHAPTPAPSGMASNPEPKKRISRIQKEEPKPKRRSAILGGGDIAFPLLVSSTLLLSVGWPFAVAVTIGAAVGLAMLLYLSEKDRFYPAMPFIAAGCMVGFGFASFFQFLI